jgi:hypothetical protein
MLLNNKLCYFCSASSLNIKSQKNPDYYIALCQTLTNGLAFVLVGTFCYGKSN